MVIAASFDVHAAPVRAEASPTKSGPLTLYFDKDSSFPNFTMYCGDATLAADLADAINGVLTKHHQKVAP